MNVQTMEDAYAFYEKLGIIRDFRQKIPSAFIMVQPTIKMFKTITYNKMWIV